MKITCVSVLVILISTACFAKRLIPEPVPSIISHGYEYKVPHNFSNIKGGHVQAIDLNSNEVIWTIQLYKTDYKLDLEQDIQDVFISKIEIDPSGSILTITDELGRLYKVDIKARKVLDVD